MRRARIKMVLGSAVLLGTAMIGLSGCDYWPPALQAQIEQLKMEVQLSATERAKLESQLRETTQARDQMQPRVDELTRLNRELAGRVQMLETSLTTEREKVAKLTKGSKAVNTKSSAKTSGKTAKKKSTSKPKAKAKSKGTKGT